MLRKKDAVDLRSRWTVVEKLKESCTAAQGICAVGFVVLILMLAGACYKVATRQQPFLTGLGEGVADLVCLVALFFGARFFKGIGETGQPFKERRVRDLEIVANCCILLSVLPGFVTWAVGLALSAVSGGAAVPGALDFGIGLVNLPLFWISFLSKSFALVFRYGCILQQQDDGLV